ncbi:MAG: hypothetical protein RIB03_15685 [Henriciella sp.]|uniref:hypothetical protein n=1 Tax=Henriciella sp. TaxID=1968823 RepID=UPI0032F068FD
MSIEKTIAALPSLSTAERATIKDRATNWLESGSVEQKENAEKMLAALDALEEAEDKERYDRLSGMTVAQRVVEAFKEEPPTDTDTKVIKALMDHPDSTSAQLSEAVGWGAQSWHMHFGNMCAVREVFLWPAPLSEARPDKKTMTMILADYDEASSTWKMKPEAAEAFKAMGLG